MEGGANLESTLSIDKFHVGLLCVHSKLAPKKEEYLYSITDKKWAYWDMGKQH